MPVKRRKPKVRVQGFPDWQIQFMETGTTPPDDPGLNEFEILQWQYHACRKDDPVRQAWDKVGNSILSNFIKRHPGTRPYAWWEFEAPREPIGTRIGWHNDGKLVAPRKRLNGVGTPCHELLAFAPSYKFGIPDFWVDAILVKWYPHKDLHVPDPDDPPTFESQASYLDRHNLLTDDERESLPADAFEPVAYVPD